MQVDTSAVQNQFFDVKWVAAPSYMMVVEYKGTGDPFFGGAADDRILGRDGSICGRNSPSDQDIAFFGTVVEAEQAARNVPNRREGSRIGVLPVWDRNRCKRPRLISALKTVCNLSEGEARACLDRREPEAVRHLGGWQQAIQYAITGRRLGVTHGVR